MANYRWKFYSNRTRKKTFLRRFKNIGIASEKLYRNTLIVFDDRMIDASKDKRIVNRFTRGSHLHNLSVIYIVQNLFQQGKGSRSTSLNSHHLVLFKNPRDKLQILPLAKQMYPGQTDFFSWNQCEEAVKTLWLPTNWSDNHHTR